MTAMYHIANGKSPPLGNVLASEDLKAFVSACCNVDPTSRPSVCELMRFPFVANCVETSECLCGDDDNASVLSSASQGGGDGGEGARSVLMDSDSPPPSPPPSPPSVSHTLAQDMSMEAISALMDEAGQNEAVVVAAPAESESRMKMKHNVDIKVDTKASELNRDHGGPKDTGNLQNQETPHMHKTRKSRLTTTHVDSIEVKSSVAPPPKAKRKVPPSISTIATADATGCDTPTPPAAHHTPMPPKDAKTPSTSGRIRQHSGGGTSKPPASPAPPGTFSAAPTAPSSPVGTLPTGCKEKKIPSATDSVYCAGSKSGIAGSVSSRAGTAIATIGGEMNSPLPSPTRPMQHVGEMMHQLSPAAAVESGKSPARVASEVLMQKKLCAQKLADQEARSAEGEENIERGGSISRMPTMEKSLSCTVWTEEGDDDMFHLSRDADDGVLDFTSAQLPPGIEDVAISRPRDLDKQDIASDDVASDLQKKLETFPGECEFVHGEGGRERCNESGRPCPC
jgi:serine/threonine protein kinase